MPGEQWNVYNFAARIITAQEARDFGLIDDIADFSLP